MPEEGGGGGVVERKPCSGERRGQAEALRAAESLRASCRARGKISSSSIDLPPLPPSLPHLPAATERMSPDKDLSGHPPELKAPSTPTPPPLHPLPPLTFDSTQITDFHVTPSGALVTLVLAGREKKAQVPPPLDAAAAAAADVDIWRRPKPQKRQAAKRTPCDLRRLKQTNSE